MNKKLSRWEGYFIFFFLSRVFKFIDGANQKAKSALYGESGACEDLQMVLSSGEKYIFYMDWEVMAKILPSLNLSAVFKRMVVNREPTAFENIYLAMSLGLEIPTE